MRWLWLSLLLFAGVANAQTASYPGGVTYYNPAHFDLDALGVSLDARIAAIVSEDGNILLPAPVTASTTDGIAEYLAEVPAGGTLTLGAGTYTISTACTDTTTSDGADANNTAGGGVFILNGTTGLTIEGRGMDSTKIEWHTPFTVSACGLAGQSGAVFSLFRIGAGASSSSNVTQGITFRGLGISVIQTDLASAANVQAPPACFHITDRGTTKNIEWDHVSCTVKQDEIAGGAVHTGYGVFIDNPATGVIATHQNLKYHDGRFLVSGVGVYNNATDLFLSERNEYRSVIETGYACSYELFYKKDGQHQIDNDRYLFDGNCATHCGMAAPGEYALRWGQLDSRGARDFAGSDLTVSDSVFKATPSCAARMFEGIYGTGYNFVSFNNNLFKCTIDDIDSDVGGDTIRDVCVITGGALQIDKRNNGSDTPCPTGQSCNIGWVVTNNRFLGFMDTYTSGGVAFADGCPIMIQQPDGGDLGDNWWSLIANNMFMIPDGNGDPDTGAQADGFCTTSTTWLDFNFIVGNAVVGTPKLCLASQGTEGCALESDIVNRNVTPVLASYTGATMPSADTANADDGDGRVVIITDGSSATDCGTGGGANINICRDNGAAWGVP